MGLEYSLVPLFESLAVIEDQVDGWAAPAFQSLAFHHISSCLGFLFHIYSTSISRSSFQIIREGSNPGQ